MHYYFYFVRGKNLLGGEKGSDAIIKKPLNDIFCHSLDIRF